MTLELLKKSVDAYFQPIVDFLQTVESNTEAIGNLETVKALLQKCISKDIIESIKTKEKVQRMLNKCYLAATEVNQAIEQRKQAGTELSMPHKFSFSKKLANPLVIQSTIESRIILLKSLL